MCIRRKRLTAARARERHLCLDQLQSEGLDVGEGAYVFEDSDQPCALEVSRYDGCAIISDFPPMNFALSIPLRIVAHHRTIVADCSIEVPWREDVHVASLRKRRGSYHLGPFTYPEAEVLNDYLETSFMLKGGRIFEGVLLAYGCAPIPDDIRSGSVRVRVTLLDHSDRKTSVVVGLAVRRPAMNILASTATATAKSRTAMALFGEPDNSLQVGDGNQPMGLEPSQQRKHRPHSAKLEVTSDNR